MIRLERILINGFKNSKSSVDVVLSNANTSIIFGENGSGKTSFLKILHAVFSLDESVFIQNQVNTISIFYSVRGRFESINIKKKYETQKKTNEKSEYDWSEYANSELFKTSSIFLGVDRGVINQPLKIDVRMIAEFFRIEKNSKKYLKDINYFLLADELTTHIRLYQSKYRNRHSSSSPDFETKNLYLQSIKMDNIEELLIERYRLARVTATKRIQSALLDTLAVAISLDESGPSLKRSIPYNFNNLVLEHADRIVEALDDGSENKFKTRVIEILKDPYLSLELDRLSAHPILSQLFLNMINELKLEKQMLSSINLLVDNFNQYLINDKELIVNGEMVAVRVGSNIHPISELSSGERHMLTFLSLVLFEGGRRNFLIIDEPEISLNINWQRRLMSLFSDLIPETQIIVASHSPSLANNNPNFLCELELRLG